MIGFVGIGYWIYLVTTQDWEEVTDNEYMFSDYSASIIEGEIPCDCKLYKEQSNEQDVPSYRREGQTRL